jgi:hypothetical protein
MHLLHHEISIQVGYLMLLLCGKPCLEHIHNVSFLIVYVIGIGTLGTMVAMSAFTTLISEAFHSP